MDNGLAVAMRLEGRDEYAYILGRIGVELEGSSAPPSSSAWSRRRRAVRLLELGSLQ